MSFTIKTAFCVEIFLATTRILPSGTTFSGACSYALYRCHYRLSLSIRERKSLLLDSRESGKIVIMTDLLRC